MPAEYRSYQASWLERNPGWEHRVWTEQDLAVLEMRNRDLFDAAVEHTAHLPAVDTIRWRVDVARLEILWQFGGVYADADAECLRPLGGLIPYRMCVPQSPNDPSYVTNAVMGAEPGHPFLDALIGGMPANATAYRGRRLVDTVGGKYISRQIAALKPPGVAVLPWWLFAGQSIRDRDRGRPPDLSRPLINHVYGNTRGRRVLR
jgi:mannosyltransferase OCH1-like enzyme